MGGHYVLNFLEGLAAQEHPHPPKWGVKGSGGVQFGHFILLQNHVYQKMTQQKTMCNNIANYGKFPHYNDTSI